MISVSSYLKKLSLICLIFFNFSSIHPTPNPATPQEEEIQTLVQNQLEIFLKDVIAQLNGVDLILENLALIISSEQAYKNTRNELIEQIKFLREAIGTLKGDSFAQVDLPYLNLLAKINQALLENVAAAIKSNLTEITMPNLESIVTKNAGLMPDPQEFMQLLANNNAKLAAINKTAKNVGLHWYNHAYRTIDDYIIQPSIRHKAPRRIGQLLLAATLTAYGLYCSSTENKMLRSALGYPPETDRFGNLDRAYHYGINPDTGKKIPEAKKHPLKWLGGTELNITNFKNGLRPIGTFGLSLAMIAYKDDLLAGLNWCKKKIQNAATSIRGGSYQTKKTGANHRFNPKITFDDLVGLKHQKEALSFVVKYIEDPERFDRAKLTPEKGYLLTGPTRTGKSYMAEALAGEIKAVLKRQNKNPQQFGFYSINASIIIEKGIGYILDLAKAEAPCVIFIDEIDLLGLQRAGGDRTVLSEFLISMSGCLESETNKQVIILAATNKPENLDFALKQRGRFGKEIRFEYPGIEDRKDFIERKLSKLAINLHAIDLDKLARETEGCSYEDLNAVITKAFQDAKIRGEVLNQNLLDHAHDTEVRNIITRAAKDLPAHEQRLIAIHQASNALVCTLLNTQQKLALVTINPVMAKLKEESVWNHYNLEQNEAQKQKPIVYGKMFTYHNSDTINMSSETEKLNICKIHLAGYAAERLILGSCGYSYYPDNKEQALEITKSIVLKGINLNRLPQDLQTKKYEQSLALLEKLEQEVFNLLKQNKDTLEVLVEALIEHKTLNSKQVEALMYPERATEIPAVSSEQIQKELGITEATPAA